MSVYPLGIIAGGGSLPALLVNECARQNRPVFIVGFEGQTDPALYEGRAHLLSRPDKAGAIIAWLKNEKVHDLVLIGSIQRPHLTDMRPDFFTAGFFAKMGLRALGDSDLLSAVRKALEKEGFRIHAVQNFLGDILVPEGALGKVKPTPAQQIDIDLGIQTAHALGELDIGQSVVVRDGVVLGVEGVEGTDELLRRCAAYRTNGRGGILVKACKPQQDRALDLPTIGLNTVQLCAALHMEGIAISAGEALMGERAEAIRLADQAGLFVMGVGV